MANLFFNHLSTILSRFGKSASPLELHELVPGVRVLVLEEEAPEDEQVPDGQYLRTLISSLLELFFH